MVSDQRNTLACAACPVADARRAPSRCNSPIRVGTGDVQRTGRCIGTGSQHWVGIAGAARFQATSIFALAPCLEWFNDFDGFSTGTKQKVKEFTMTAEFKTGDALVTRLEYRRDWSDAPCFERGTGGTYKSQNTLLVGLVAYFGPKK